MLICFPFSCEAKQILFFLLVVGLISTTVFCWCKKKKDPPQKKLFSFFFLVIFLLCKLFSSLVFVELPWLWSAHVCVSVLPLAQSRSALLCSPEERGNRQRAEREKKASLSLSLSLSHSHTHTSHPSQGSTNSRAPDSTPTPPLLPHCSPSSSHYTPPEPCLNSLSFSRSLFHSLDSIHNTNLLPSIFLLLRFFYLLFLPPPLSPLLFLSQVCLQAKPPRERPNLHDTA